MTKEQKNSGPTIYKIKIKGRLEDRWTNWFEGLAFTYEDDGTTTIQGPLPDQAAMHGVLNRIRDLSLSLISVQNISDIEKE